MELFIVAIAIVLIAAAILPWINAIRIGMLKKEVLKLNVYIQELEGGKLPAPLTTPAPTKNVEEKTSTQPRNDTKDFSVPFGGGVQPAPLKSSGKIEKVEKISKPENKPERKSTFEQNIATKLPVWIGAISLICAAFFLVKYSIELGWLGPTVRTMMGGLFGAGLIAAGNFIVKRPQLPNAERISQGLTGAGLVSLYVTIYAAIHLYALLPSAIGFFFMVGVTGLAVVLSLRHGQTIAAFALAGGLLTPALIGSDEPNAAALFTYLFLLFGALFTVLVRKGWWTLAIISLIGVFFWSGFWFLTVFSADDAIVLVMFAMALCALVLAVTGRRISEDTLSTSERRPVHILNLAAISGGVITIMSLSAKITLTLFDWSMLGVLSFGLMALAYFQPSTYRKPLWVKFGASLLLLLIWGEDAALSQTMTVIAGMVGVYVIVPGIIMRKVNDPRIWATMQAIAALSLFLISYTTLPVSQSLLQTFGMFWGIISLVLASLCIYQAADIRKKYAADLAIQDYLVAIYALAASAFISAGLAIELPFDYLPVGIALQIAATTWIFRRTGITFLRRIVVILTLALAAIHFKQILLFLSLAFTSLIDETLRSHEYTDLITADPLITLGLPSIAMFAAFWIFENGGKGEASRSSHILFGTATSMAFAAAYYVVRDVFFADPFGHPFSHQTGFVLRGLITMSVIGMGIAMLHLRGKLSVIPSWGKVLFVFGMMRFVYFDLLLHNPFWDSSQYVGANPLVNGITLTYGLSALATFWAIRNRDLLKQSSFTNGFYKILGFLSLFAFSSFTVRQYFHGGLMDVGHVSAAELYGYSAAWLVTGLALLTFGIRMDSKTARMASLAFIVLAVFKVFLFDAAELEGLFRIFSFLGLGVSLIGLSFFYSKFVFGKEERVTNE